MNTSMEHISDFAVYLFFAVALNSDWNANSFLWWGSIAFLIGAYVVSKGLQIEFAVTQFKVWMLAFLGICLISVCFSIDKANSFNMIISLVVLMTILALLDDKIQTKGQLEKCMKLLAMAIFTMMIYLVFTVDLIVFQLVQRGLAESGRWNGNDIGMKCSIFLLLSVYFFDTDNRVLVRIGLLAASALALLLLYYTASRTALLITLIGFGLYFYFKYPSRRFLNILVIIAASCAVLGLSLSIPKLYDVIGWRIEGAIAAALGRGNADHSALLREEYIQVGMKAFKKSPVIGYGIDSFRFLNFQKTGRLTYSHNNFVEILTGVGCVGFVAYYFYYIMLAADFLYVYHRREVSLMLNIAAACFFSMWIVHFFFIAYYDLLPNLLILFFAKALVLFGEKGDKI